MVCKTPTLTLDWVWYVVISKYEGQQDQSWKSKWPEIPWSDPGGIRVSPCLIVIFGGNSENVWGAFLPLFSNSALL